MSELFYPATAIKFPVCMKSEDGRHRFTQPNVVCDFCNTGGVIVGDEVLYVPTEKGLEYHQSNIRNLLFYGGRGSAKSTTGRWDCHLRAMSNPGFKYVILRTKFPELDKSHLVFIPKEVNALGATYNSTVHRIYYPNGSVGFFSHCANEEAVLNLLSAEFYLMFFDEISTFEWEHVVKLAASIRAPQGSAIDIPLLRGATNPFGTSSMDINKYFILKDVDPLEEPEYNPEDWGSIKANVEDNPYLPKEEYLKRFVGLPPHVRKAWVDGDFAMENGLFDFHPLGDGRGHGEAGKPYHVVNDIDLKKILANSVVYRAMDAGWFPDPTVCIWFAHLGNRHIAFHEETWYKTTAAEIASDIKRIDKELGVSKVAITYCDPSMDINTTADVKTLKEVYEDNGIPMENSINNREMYATFMHNALAEQPIENTPRLQIYNSGNRGCPMLVRTIPLMKYDEKRPKFMADHKKDHWVVTACYYLMSNAADPRTAISGFGGQMRPWMRPKAPKQFQERQ